MINNNLYIFLHLPKTGGSTFRKHIEKNVSKNERLLVSYQKLRYSRTKNNQESYISEFKKDISKIKDADKEKIKIIYGHEIPYGVHTFFSKNPKYITFVRNPDDRIISLYNFFKTMYFREDKYGKAKEHYHKQFLINGKVPVFSEWLQNKYATAGNGVENINTLLLNLGYLRHDGDMDKNINLLLDKFYFLGITEMLDDDLTFLYNKLRIKKLFLRQNISTKHIGIDEAKKNEELLRCKNSFDYLIYKGALKRNKSNKLKNIFISNKRKRSFLFILFTQLLFDTENTFIILSNYLKRKSNMYNKVFNFIRRNNK